MKYHLVLAVSKGSLKDTYIHIDVNAKSDEQALMFAKGVHELKTFKDEPIEFAAYILRKRYYLIYWKVIKYVDPTVQHNPAIMLNAAKVR
jgi:hypothetical protein